MGIVLKSAELFDYLDGSVAKPVKAEGETDAAFNARLAIWMTGDLKAQKTMVVSVDAKIIIIDLIQNSETAQAMWNKLIRILSSKPKRMCIFCKKSSLK